ncbi:MAG: family 78 glycoside hydrolase catalytic domain [Kiritimatiellae bacterium]|nr:family 78 glycoside hydrolase catalytic domain [Kiritimatiellia bacterium]
MEFYFISSDWKSSWIGLPQEQKPAEGALIVNAATYLYKELPPKDCPRFRKIFTLDKSIRRATASVCGLGFYELYLNGKKAGDHVLAPANSSYKQRVFFDTLDVTAALKQGENAAGLWLAPGYASDYSKWGWKWEEPKPGIFIFDMGQNFAGWVRLRAKGAAGSRITLRHSELLGADGMLDTWTNRRAESTDLFILSGQGVETYEPRFTYHGFRYVEVSGYPGKPTRDDITGCVVHSDVRNDGHFICSDETINRIQSNSLCGSGQYCIRDSSGTWKTR